MAPVPQDVFEYQGELLTVRDLQKRLGISGPLLRARLRRMPLVEALTTPVRKSVGKPVGKSVGRLAEYTWQGKTQTLGAWGRELRMLPETIEYRLKIGLTFEQAVTKPKSKVQEKDLTGKVAGHLTVVGRVGEPGTRPEQWRVRCACGTEKVYAVTQLVHSPWLQSCGCHPRISYLGRGVRSLLGDTSAQPEYTAWRRIRALCSLPEEHLAYGVYAERGIRMCERWAGDFLAFYADMGPRPGPGYSLDRLNPHGDFEPGNCYWATRSENTANRNAIWLTHEGQTLRLTQWAERTGLPHLLLQSRLNQGWTPERALTTPEGR